MISVCFQDKPFNITVIQVYALTTNAKEAEVERFYEDLQDLDEAQAGIKIAGRNIYNLRYGDDTTLMTERKEELKSLLMKVKSPSRVQLFATTWAAASQAPPSIGFSRQEYRSAVPLPSPSAVREVKQILLG